MRDDDVDDDRPRRRRRDRDDDSDDRPRRRDREPAKGVPTGRIVLGVVLLFGVLSTVLAVFVVWPAMKARREARVTAECSQKMLKIGVGVYGYDDAARALPPVGDELSWRVWILPHVPNERRFRMQNNELVHKFKLNQPWDSPTNRPLADVRVDEYVSADAPPDTVETPYRVFVGPNTLYPTNKAKYTINNVPDGVSNTIFAVEAAETVPWSQPKELPLPVDGPLPALGRPNSPGVLVLKLDGSVIRIKKNADEAVWRIGINPEDGLLFDP